MLWWSLILEEYGTDIQYIPGAKNIVAYNLYRLPPNRQPKSTHKSNYNTEKLLEMYGV